MSHEANYRSTDALPKGELAKHWVLLRSKRTRSLRPLPPGERGAQVVGMTTIGAREDVTNRRVPGHWVGDLIVGAHGESAAATLVECTTRYMLIHTLPPGKDATALHDVLIAHATSCQ